MEFDTPAITHYHDNMGFKRFFRLLVVLLLGVLLLTRSDMPPADQLARIRYFTREIEFDFITWTINALSVKVAEMALGTVAYIPEEYHDQMKLDYLTLVREIQRGEAALREIYTDPNIADPEQASAELRGELQELYAIQARRAPVAEGILQSQVATIAADIGLSLGGQPVPPVLYHVTPLPLAMIVSPRDAIREDAHISLVPELTLDEQVRLEEEVDQAIDVASLVVPVGGVGLYPTMVMQTTDINWLSEVVAHEWIHNYLTLRPLGINYLSSPALRTMNETAAAIAGKEMGYYLVERYYPDYLPPYPPWEPPDAVPTAPHEPPAFDFRAEMRETRVTVDELLRAGKIEEAEAYMEERRRFLWDHGYRIRKINQAYFAFYGAYADLPGGEAGEDPVGAAVRALRDQSHSLADFINRISWMSSFKQLEQVVSVPAEISSP